MGDTTDTLIPWDDLPVAQQLELREQYGNYLDDLPTTCSPEEKLERFRAWLAERGVSYEE
ncbi:hypothetical protein CH339_20510 [Rhodobium orientis]|uniref:Uncharacterized protein n=2 Tax=Rhodobium orientis TaxID=34017 RepID=A0A327JEN3_9HYPH|nr:hypothetical protein [Rhodobium orientis]RAI24907.1 hypothetical protein CH339_20510 [Rhodobium orientis]